MFCHKGNIIEGSTGLAEACGCLDKVGIRLTYNAAHLDFLLFGKKAGLDDDLKKLTCAGSLYEVYLIFNIVVFSVLDVADIYYHIDLIGAVLNGIGSLKSLYFRSRIAIGEADNCADLYLARSIYGGVLNKGCRDTNRSGPVLNAIVNNGLYLFPCGILSQQGVVNFS